MKRDRIKTLLLAEALICALLASPCGFSRATPFLSPDSPAAQWGRV